MREIKFRGLDECIENWVYGYLANSFVINDINSKGHLLKGVLVDSETVGQFTGLLDKNGKEIYEGDVVQIVAEDYLSVIEWDIETCRFIINNQSENTLCDFDNYYGNELEIVGNIHENPELLEVE